MIFELETAIEAELNALEISRGESLFVNVHNYHTLKSDGYPYCTFEMNDFTGEYLDSCSNKREFKFTIVCLQVINTELKRDEGKRILYNCLEKIIDRFDGNMDMDGLNVVRGDVSKGEL